MVETAYPVPIAPHKVRIALLDQLRGMALIAMAIFHLSWDLEFFYYLEPGTVSSPGMTVFARSIASSFLFLSGFSLFLGHFPKVRVRPFARRLAMLAASAAAITAVTWHFMPGEFIFFGILHCIAAASLLGLVFLRLPWPITVIVAVACILAPWTLRADLFNAWWLWWVGLSTRLPRSNDYVPLLPWLGPFLLGLALAKVFQGLEHHAKNRNRHEASCSCFRIGFIRKPVSTFRSGALMWLERLSELALPQNHCTLLLTKAGRNSLIFYLVHQPVLIACVWCLAQWVPAAPPDPQAGYIRTCEKACSDGQGMDFCTVFCSCTLDKLLEKKMFSELQLGSINIEQDERIASISAICSAGAQ